MKKITLTIFLLILLTGCNNQQQINQEENQKNETQPTKTESQKENINPNDNLSDIEKKESNKIIDDDDNQEKVFIKKKGEVNYVIYINENGKEFIIDEAPQFPEPDKIKPGTLSDYKTFLDVNFSPKKNYILYRFKAYDIGELTQIYDIINQKIVDKISGNILNFTPDEKYLYSCGRDFFLGYGKVYQIPEFKEVYSVYGKIIGEEKVEFNNGYGMKSCSYNDQKNRIEFVLVSQPEPKSTSDLNESTKRVFFDIKN